MIKHELDLLEIEIKNKKRLCMAVNQDSPEKTLASKYVHKKNSDILVTEPYAEDLLALAPNIARITSTPSRNETLENNETLQT